GRLLLFPAAFSPGETGDLPVRGRSQNGVFSPAPRKISPLRPWAMVSTRGKGETLPRPEVVGQNGLSPRSPPLWPGCRSFGPETAALPVSLAGRAPFWPVLEFRCIATKSAPRARYTRCCIAQEGRRRTGTAPSRRADHPGQA